MCKNIVRIPFSRLNHGTNLKLSSVVGNMLRQLRCCSGKKRVKAPVTSVKFSALFRFATKTDIILMYAALSAAILNGVCLPLMVLLWGNLANIIIEFSDPGANNTATGTHDITYITQCLSPSNSTTNSPIFM